MNKRKEQNTDAHQTMQSTVVATLSGKTGQPALQADIIPLQKRMKGFEKKAGELVSIMLALTEEHMAAMPSGAADISPVTSLTLVVKYALDAYIKTMKAKKT